MGQAYFTLPYQNRWLHIPEHTLSGREKALLKQLLLNETQTTSEIPKNPWAQFLLGQTTEVPTGLAQTQLLQFSLSYREEDAGSFDQTLWLDAFSQTLPLVRECFFLDGKSGVFILDSPEPYCIDEELTAVLDVLDDDFSLRTALYLGQRWPVDSRLPLLFEEERKIFAASRTIAKGSKITTLAAIALPYFISESGNQNPVLQALADHNRFRRRHTRTDNGHVAEPRKPVESGSRPLSAPQYAPVPDRPLFRCDRTGLEEHG